MGEAIVTSQFSESDFLEFEARLLRETELLATWFEEGRFSEDPPVGGLELEAWLIDADGRPAPRNEAFLDCLGDPAVVAELAKFNVEFNTAPRPLTGPALTDLSGELERTWNRGQVAARSLQLELLAIGILPTLRDRDLTLENMSSQERFRALNEQVLRLRHERPITLDISGRDTLFAIHRDVMLEAAATSFQVHMQVPASRAARCFNAALVLSGPMVAITANSPLLFGCDLWTETRIPLFEQAVSVTPHRSDRARRVTFGGDYVQESLLECFRENMGSYAVLLPILNESAPEKLRHVRLHNGTIWRWNRPLIGFGPDGRPHLRVEHRVIPAGPSLIDTAANMALFHGLVHALASSPEPPERFLPFDRAKSNFYAAAREGLDAEMAWMDSRRVPTRELWRDQLLPLARQGLERLNIDQDDIGRFLDIVAGRLRTGQTGSVWQREFFRSHGGRRDELTLAYREQQRRGHPVHEWPL